MKKHRWLFKLIIAVVITVLLLVFLQELLTPKYMSSSKEGAMVAEYYDYYGDNDVIFIGDCEVYENISPVTLYEEYGITSYIRGSAQQLMWHSYYLLAETLEYETPKVVVFNVLAMMYGSNEDTGSQSTREAYNRMTLDGMRWSSYKWDAIQASLTDEEEENNGAWSYIFPILRYHSRWNELSSEDFKYLFNRDQVTDQGYLMQVGVQPVIGEYTDREPADTNFADICWEYLDKIKDLCEENGITLILMKAPSLYPIWYDAYEEQIVEYAEENDLYYINFLDYQDEIGIDWNTDTYDQGLHLNVYGAEKLSSYLGEILKEQADLPDRREDEKVSEKWEGIISTYDERKAALEAEAAAEE